ncbi:MAG: hypothetical protein JRI68_32435, partial [Deltaproteobacteria bacterium]|nr:hypothetical protein [Deltaproteobacteria bacterium]
RPEVVSEHGEPIDPEELASREKRVGETLECPYCQEPFTKIELEETPFMEWDLGFVYVCMNDRCSYYVTSFEEMAAQGNMGYSCRLLYDPVRDRLQPTADVKGPVDVQSRLAPRG